MLASQRAAPRRRAAAGQAFFCGLHRADGPSAARTVGRAFFATAIGAELWIGLISRPPAAQQRPGAPP